MADIGIIGGAGYVGLITGVGLAALGHKVSSQDIDRERLELLQTGQSIFWGLLRKCFNIGLL